MEFRIKDFISLTSQSAKEKEITIIDGTKEISEKEIDKIFNCNILKISCKNRHLVLYVDSQLPIDKTIYRNNITNFNSAYDFYYYLIDTTTVAFRINYHSKKVDYLYGFDWEYDEETNRMKLWVEAYNSFINPFHTIYIPTSL